MKPGPLPGAPEYGSKVTTACGGFVPLEFDTPRSQYKGQPIYFCLAVCKEDFDRNPARSCFSCQLLSEDSGENR